MSRPPTADRSLEANLRQALDRREFALEYQPKVALNTGVILGVEALIRWVHPQRGVIPPADFVPAAEQCGLIVPIGNWVLNEACRQARAWIDGGLGEVPIAVNVSAVEFGQRRFYHGVCRALSDSGLDPRLLELELTETALMEHVETAAAALRLLRADGVRLAIDDFGTGYSSLSYLRMFSVDALKVDRSFIQEMSSDLTSGSIVTAVIRMGRSLKMRVIAEGVETQEQAAFLRAEGCGEAQGHYFFRAMPSEQVARLLARASDETAARRPA
jgi:EAL domain-containing protein (putative c-di-GMP-specific phosphodiesterase class I)